MADLAQLLAQCEEMVADLDFASVHRWLERNPGGKVLGHFQVYFPQELAHAAGMLPIAILGADSQLEARRADSRLGSFICSICKTSLELQLSGRLRFMSIFVTHPICDAARSLAGIWGRNFDGHAEILYLPQNVNSGYAATYLRHEYDRLQEEIERVTGRTVTTAALNQSIRLFNENRRLLRAVYALKQASPWLVSVSEAYLLTRVGAVLPKEEHNAILRQALDLLAQRKARPQDKLRVVFEGGFCEQPPLDLLRIIEDSCYVVDDDLLIGMRWLTADVPDDTDDPLFALAESYIERSSYSPVQRDTRKPKEAMLLRRLQGARAVAAIVAAAKMCEPGLDEQVAYQKHFDHQDIPYLLLEFEGKEQASEQARMQIETFVESILFD